MKIITILSFLLCFSFVKASAQQINSAELQVNGLTCSMCSQATEKSLKTLDFLGSVKPDLNKNLFVIAFKKDKKVNLDLIKKKVQDAGFSVGSLVVSVNYENVQVDAKGQATVDGVIYRFDNVKNKTLNGVIKTTVVDKQFVTNTVFKQKAAKFNSMAYNTGMETINGKKTRIYHLSV